ncbi:MAG TPA: ABC transporter permease [Dehalococcoidia bacterium]|nr:ABC transporter permease [Dehalococcoidia bacterium]
MRRRLNNRTGETSGSRRALPRLALYGVMPVRKVWLFGRRSPLAAVCAAILIVAALAAVFADAVATHDPLAQDIPNRLKPAGGDFLLGTDNFGRDVFSRIVHGSQISLYVAVMSVLAGTVLGTSLGMASAYLAGWVDLVAQRVVDASLGFPLLVLTVVIVVALGASTHTVVFAIAVALMPQMVRLSRSRALSVKEEAYVMAARAAGASLPRIVLKHILPHSLGPIIAHATGWVGAALVAESALSFLGLGVPPPYPSWGGMLQEGRQYLEVAPWLTVLPGLALTITVLSFALLGDALRDELDPRGSVRSPAKY